MSNDSLIACLQQAKDDLVWIVTGNGWNALSASEQATISHRIRLIEDTLVAYNLDKAEPARCEISDVEHVWRYGWFRGHKAGSTGHDYTQENKDWADPDVQGTLKRLAPTREPVPGNLADALIGLNKAVDAYWNGVGTLDEEKAVTLWQKRSKVVLQEHGYVN